MTFRVSQSLRREVAIRRVSQRWFGIRDRKLAVSPTSSILSVLAAYRILLAQTLRPPLLWLLSAFVIANMAGAPAGVIVPLLIKFNLAADWAAHDLTFETTLALLGVASGIGGVLGGLLVSTWGGLKRDRVYGVLVPMLAAGIVQVIYGLSPLMLISAVAAFIGAAMGPILNAHSQSIWQSHTPRELQGRVFSIRRLIAWTILPVSTAIGDTLAGLFDPGYMLAVLGTIYALFSAAQLFNPYLLRVEESGVRH